MADASSGSCVEVESIAVSQTRLYLKIDCDFRDQKDRAYFYYSLNGEDWVPSRAAPADVVYSAPLYGLQVCSLQFRHRGGRGLR